MKKEKNIFGYFTIPKFAFILFFFFLSNFVWAQNQQEEIFNHPLNPQTASAFNAACANLSRHEYITGSFEQTRRIIRSNRSLVSSGNFIIASSTGMVWDTVKPVRSSITLGSDFVIQARGNRRTVTNAQGNEFFLRTAEVLSMIFTGNARGLLDNFNVYFSGNPDSWELGLIPQSGIIQSYMQKIIIKGGTSINYIQINEQAGDIVIYTLSNHNFPAELSVNEKAFFILP